MKHITFYFDFDLAVRLPGLRAPAAGARGPELRACEYRPVLFAGAAQALGPEGPGRDRAQARLDLSPRALAGARARHRDADAGGASVQPAAAAAPGAGLRADGRRRTGASCETMFRHVWRGGADGRRPGAAGGAGGAARAGARPGRRRRQGSELRDATDEAHRARRVRRADASRSTAACSGASTRCRCCAPRCRATPGSTAPHGTPRRRCPRPRAAAASFSSPQRIYGRASNTRLNGVSVARRKRLKPPSRTGPMRASPVCAPRHAPTSCAHEAGVQMNVDASLRTQRLCARAGRQGSHPRAFGGIIGSGAARTPTPSGGNMQADLVTRIANDPKYQELKAKRTRFGWLLTVLMMIVYYGFIAAGRLRQGVPRAAPRRRRDDDRHADRPRRHRLHDRHHRRSTCAAPTASSTR